MLLTPPGIQPVYHRIWRPSQPGADPRPAVFLDRDGVLTEDTGYLQNPADVRFLPGALATVAELNRLGYPVVLVTNQSGIGRGYFDWTAYERVSTRIREELAAAGATLDAEWACGYYPGKLFPEASDARRYRKPEPGMILEAARQLALDLSSSWLAGDKPSDIAAALRAYLRGALHVATGYGAATRPEVLELLRTKTARTAIRFGDSLADLLPLLTPEASAGTRPT